MKTISPYSGDHYRSGDNYMVCDECGLTKRKSEIRKRWDGAMVCRKDWEPRHPQEFVRGKADRIAVKNARLETFQAVLNDDCSATTGWTLGSGWTHDDVAYEFVHGSGTAVLDRAVAGLTNAANYLLQITTTGRTVGSVVVSLVTATTEDGDLTITEDGLSDITFTAAATTDTIRLTPSTDFDGSIQVVTIYPATTAITQDDL